MPAAWDISKGDPSVVIAVVDTGVDPATPDLKNALVDGWDFIANGPTRVDPGGHGTLGATIVAGRGNDGQGVAGYCWLCRVMPIRVSADGNAFDPYPASLGIRWAVDHGARIISLAFSDEGASTIANQQVAGAIAYASQRGVLVLASAGNTGGTGPHASGVRSRSLCGGRHRSQRRAVLVVDAWAVGAASRRLAARWGSGPGTA